MLPLIVLGLAAGGTYFYHKKKAPPPILPASATSIPTQVPPSAQAQASALATQQGDAYAAAMRARDAAGATKTMVIKPPPPPTLSAAQVHAELPKNLSPTAKTAHVDSYMKAVASGSASQLSQVANSLQNVGAVKAATNLIAKVEHFTIPGINIKLF